MVIVKRRESRINIGHPSYYKENSPLIVFKNKKETKLACFKPRHVPTVTNIIFSPLPIQFGCYITSAKKFVHLFFSPIFLLQKAAARPEKMQNDTQRPEILFSPKSRRKKLIHFISVVLSGMRRLAFWKIQSRFRWLTSRKKKKNTSLAHYRHRTTPLYIFSRAVSTDKKSIKYFTRKRL